MQTKNPGLKILVIRPDRVGDVILSTPVFEVLKKHYPKSHLTVMVREPVAPLVRGLPAVDDVMIFDPDHRHAGMGGVFRLMGELSERDFRIAVVLQTNWVIAAALFGAGVRYRVGPLSKPHSFLFYNRGVRQSRSQVEMHETDYNLQLLRRIGIRAGTRTVPVQVSVSDEMRASAIKWLETQGWGPDTPASKDSRLIVIHPGMGGSALNWTDAHYTELARALIREGHRVLVTGGPTEGPILARIRHELGPIAEKARFYGGPEIGPIDFLAGIFSQAAVVIAPSTGPLHLAVALDRPVVTFYPPIRVQSVIRWGPYVSDESRASVLVPDMYCGEDFHCRGNLCNYFPCMKTLSVTQALEEVHKQLMNADQTRSGQIR